MRYKTTHILERDVYNEITCAMRQNHLKDSLVIIAVCNLKDLLSTWWSTITTMDLFRASPFYLYV